MTFLIYGWIPVRYLNELRDRFHRQFGSRVILEDLPIDRSERDRIPVALGNPSWIRPFERFMRVLHLPRYGTVDPTPFIAVFFPVFFGIIVGDIGYGAVLLLAAWLARRRFGAYPLVPDMSCIFIWAALSSMLWGVAYGEFFGDLGERMGMRPLFINRMEEFPKTILFVLLVGAVHLLLGIALGIFTAVRNRDRRELIGKSTVLVLMIAFLGLIGGLAGWLPPVAVTAGVWGLVVGIPVLFLGGGARSAMGLHSLVNILSYLRIVGIGAASVAFALAANKLGFLVKNAALGIAIGLILHLTHLAFGIFSSTIQSLRLHYVEFFENFYEGGGREYRPFRRLG
jgi:V/A-type H+-transporting ATPase subunit I